MILIALTGTLFLLIICGTLFLILVRSEEVFDEDE